VLTRADLDAIEARLTGRDPAAELALLRGRLAEAHLVLDSLAREPGGQACGPLVLAARALLAAHGRPPWGKEGPPP
jgi:hypothetical protein